MDLVFVDVEGTSGRLRRVGFYVRQGTFDKPRYYNSVFNSLACPVLSPSNDDLKNEGQEGKVSEEVVLEDL